MLGDDIVGSVVEFVDTDDRLADVDQMLDTPKGSVELEPMLREGCVLVEELVQDNDGGVALATVVLSLLTLALFEVEGRTLEVEYDPT